MKCVHKTLSTQNWKYFRVVESIVLLLIRNVVLIIINKPEIIIRDNEKGTCMLINDAISRDRNVIKKEAPEDYKI
jgi:hypothetical protein